VAVFPVSEITVCAPERHHNNPQEKGGSKNRPQEKNRNGKNGTGNKK
jgi:hypothetical protein